MKIIALLITLLIAIVFVVLHLLLVGAAIWFLVHMNIANAVACLLMNWFVIWFAEQFHDACERSGLIEARE